MEQSLKWFEGIGVMAALFGFFFSLLIGPGIFIALFTGLAMTLAGG